MPGLNCDDRMCGASAAVNVGGHGSVAMADLRAMLAELGFPEARTFLQSGNLVFESGSKNWAALETLLETETERRLKVRTDYLLRTWDEWRAIVANNPFSREARDDPAHLVLMPLKSTPIKSDVAALESAIKGRERCRARGRELYLVYPDGIGRSKLTIGLIEGTLCTRGTARNWNTVLKLMAMAEADE